MLIKRITKSQLPPFITVVVLVRTYEIIKATFPISHRNNWVHRITINSGGSSNKSLTVRWTTKGLQDSFLHVPLSTGESRAWLPPPVSRRGPGAWSLSRPPAGPPRSMTPSASSHKEAPRRTFGHRPVPAVLAALPLHPLLSLSALSASGSSSNAAGSRVRGLRARAGACVRPWNAAGGARGGARGGCGGRGTQVSGARASPSSSPATRPPPSPPFGIRFISLEPRQRRSLRVGMRKPARKVRKAGGPGAPALCSVGSAAQPAPRVAGVTTTKVSEPAAGGFVGPPAAPAGPYGNGPAYPQDAFGDGLGAGFGSAPPTSEDLTLNSGA